jgi:hypothetical protein
MCFLSRLFLLQPFPQLQTSTARLCWTRVLCVVSPFSQMDAIALLSALEEQEAHYGRAAKRLRALVPEVRRRTQRRPERA